MSDSEKQAKSFTGLSYSKKNGSAECTDNSIRYRENNKTIENDSADEISIIDPVCNSKNLDSTFDPSRSPDTKLIKNTQENLTNKIPDSSKNLLQSKLFPSANDDKIVILVPNDPSKVSIKKSCINLLDTTPPPARAIKKTTIFPEEIEDWNTKSSGPKKSSLSPSQPSKYQKSEVGEKVIRVKKYENQHDKLSSLSRLKEKYANKKTKETRGRKDSKIETETDKHELYQFKEPIKSFTGIFIRSTQKDLELKLREFLRKSATSKLNSYEFSADSETTKVFGLSELKYSDISMFVQKNSIMTVSE